MILLSQGDKVRIVEPENIKACEAYKDFETSIKTVSNFGVYIVDTDGELLFIRNEELKFIERIEPKKTKNQRISALEKEVAELTKVVENMQSLIPKQVDLPQSGASVMPTTSLRETVQSVQNQSNNQKRAAIIEKAKQFVEERQACRKGDEVNQDRVNGNSTARNFWYETEFAIKNNKVTALVYWLEYGKKRTMSPKEIGRSKCHPHDCFNELIGKAIALGRALGLDVSEFEQAVQPDEVVVGMEVEYRYKKDNEYAFKCNIDHLAEVKTANRDLKGLDKFYSTTITNDTNARYEEAQVHESNKAF